MGVFVILFSLVALYYINIAVIQKETDEGLHSTVFVLEKAIKNGHIPESIQPVIDIEIVNLIAKDNFGNTFIFDEAENEYEEFRFYSVYRTIRNTNYKITTRTLLVEEEDIILPIIISFFFITVLMLLAQFYLNKKNFNLIWKPFFRNLDVIKNYSVKDVKPIELVETDVLEFSELNLQIEQFIKKAHEDYLNLKNFTENISHEIQTPLAIMQVKIGELMDGDSLNESQFLILSQLQQNISRISKTNNQLSVLAKIENNQFLNVSSIDLSKIIKHSTENYGNLYNRVIVINHLEKTVIKANPTLIQILIDNLISNAIKYSESGSKITLQLNKYTLDISNAGEKAINNPEHIFNRFYKEGNNKNASGIGLAIVKSICELYKYQIHYCFKNKTHTFSLTLDSL